MTGGAQKEPGTHESKDSVKAETGIEPMRSAGLGVGLGVETTSRATYRGVEERDGLRVSGGVEERDAGSSWQF